MSHKQFTFHGGVSLPSHKSASTRKAVRRASIPKELTLPLSQHIGEPAEPVVVPGQYVLKGQVIAKASGYVSAPIHAPTSGTVSLIEKRPIPHPSNMDDTCIIIAPDGKEQWIELNNHAQDYTALDPSKLRNLIRNSGIVGLGGAGFPTYIKHNPGPDGFVDTLIINGAECEPYITCDDMLMRERPQEIIYGLLIIKHALQAKRCIIAIEDNKPEAIDAIRTAALEFTDHNIEVSIIPSIYPAGSEKQLIQMVTGKQVPKNDLPIHIGIVCQNVGTTAAVYRAIHHGEPLLSRYLTIAGDVKDPCNLEVLFGTSFQHLINECGGSQSNIRRIIVGGPMMGFAMHGLDLPVIKTSNCLLIDAGQSNDLAPRKYVMPCIRCGSCADVCPVNLLPQQLYWYARSQEFNKIQEYDLFDCIECGCCDYVCPSQIPLVQYYRFAKSEVWKQEKEAQKSDLARRRHEFRTYRLEREKAEKAERHRQKKAALKSAGLAEDKTEKLAANPEKKAILEAMERVKAKKQRQKITAKNTDNLTPTQKKLVNETDERRRLQRQSQAQTTTNADKDKSEK
ncbi:MAG TPA: electron transport complex subunit RsxC [Gammaproteobacteria bacterium]|nr:electron transport complex subunit RsxC [Gammaproteobacteria bacterium]